MRSTVRTLLLTALLLAVSAPCGVAHDGGEGLVGRDERQGDHERGLHPDRVLPAVHLHVSMIQWRLDKRKDARKAAAKARRARADVRGGW